MSIQWPIGLNLLHPPLGLLQRELIPGLADGIGDLVRPGPTAPFNHVNAFGLSWTFFSVPAPFGYTLGDPRTYHQRMIQLSTVHTDLSGHDTVSDVLDAHAEGLYWLWAEAGPTRVHYEIVPGVRVQFFWLVL